MKLYHYFLPLLSLFLVRVDLTDLIPLELSVKLVEVLDGDTVIVQIQKKSERVRLHGIDAPEMGQSFLQHRGDAGVFAKKCLISILKVSKKIYLKWYGRDIYGRILGEIGESSHKMLERGCAYIYPGTVMRSKRREDL